MNRFALCAVLLSGAAVSFAQDIATEVAVTEAAPGVYMLSGANGFSSNMGLLVGDDRVVLVDDSMAPITADLVATVDELAERPIDFIVNTHVHGDHIGSNATLADNGALIFAHKNIRKRLVETLDDAGVPGAPAGGPAGLPVITFSDGVNFHVAGQDVHVRHIKKAHTDGDAIVFLHGSNVIVAGDLFFNYMFPFIDLDSGGDVKGYLAGMQRIHDMAADDTVIIPGHGELAGKDDLGAAINMLEDAMQRVAALVEQGMSKEDVLAANPLGSYHDTWNWGFITTERMTETLYRSFTE